jgi:lysophospholipase L1-like esterase
MLAQISRDEYADNWVVLGDSLSEGVGFVRDSWVSELVRQMRQTNEPSADGARKVSISLVRLRPVGRSDADRFVKFGYAADIDEDPRPATRQLWIWNLACEGTTLESDLGRLSLIRAIGPSLVVVFRGSLESIVRPAALVGGAWPFWVPASWRSYAAMDPRCYFSATWWRRAKQQFVDRIKQVTRQTLLRKAPGTPLIAADLLRRNAEELFNALASVVPRVIVCGLLPVSEERFPGSPAHFVEVNALLRRAAGGAGCEFFDWGVDLARGGSASSTDALFYRDGFHPNRAGCSKLASLLRERLYETVESGVRK